MINYIKRNKDDAKEINFEDEQDFEDYNSFLKYINDDYLLAIMSF